MRKHSKTVVLVSIVVTIVLAGATWAVAATTNDAPPKSASKALTAEDVYSADMSLEEIAKAATGKPGEVAPPCPSEADVVRLKAAKINFGPCDTDSSEGNPVIVPTDTPSPDTEKATCPLVKQHTGYSVSVPCAVGAEIVSVEPADPQGKLLCSTVTYVPRAGADRVVELLCEGDTPSAGGDAVTGPASLENPDADTEHTHAEEGDHVH